MSINRYSNFCKQRNTKSFVRSNKKRTPTQKGLLGIGALLIVIAGISILFNIPFMSLGLEGEEENNQNRNTETGSNIITDTPTTTSKTSVSADNRSLSQMQTYSEEQLANNLSQENSSTIRGLEEIRDELDKIAQQQEQLNIDEFRLKYNYSQREDIQRVSGNLNAGETLYQHLVDHNISPTEILRLQEIVKPVVDISYMNIGTKFTVHYNSEGKIIQFDYQPNQLDVYHIKIPQNELDNIEVNKDEIYREIVCFEGEIKSSLYESMVEFCNSGQLAVQLAEIFAWDIDFLTECQPGDSFKIMVEKLYRGDFYRWGDILAAVYEGEMLSTHTAILFEDSSGSNNYYDSEGRCLQKAFLRAPLDYKYISSHYTESRLHPILRIHRPHRAIDYAAPTGTPVVTIGAGTVISKYYDQGGYGNYVEIRHVNGYVTGYGHLSKFAQGLQVGQRVEQGEIIGYVGATGLATGPHLDFSISKDGVRFNFLDLEMPPASSISADYRNEFDMVKENYLSILQENI